MIKDKESVERVEDLKAQMKDLLGLDSMIDEEIIQSMKETLISQAEGEGEDYIEEVIDTVLKAVEKIKNFEFKAIIASLILIRCPMSMQKSCIELHNKMLNEVLIAHIQKQTGNNPLASLALAAILKSKKNMSEIKVSVSITLQGRVLLTQAEAEQLEKTKKGSGFNLTRIKVENEDKSVDILNIKTRKFKTASQSINLCREAYEYMTSKDSCPPHIKQFIWVKMRSKQRLEAHLDLMCKHLNGVSYTYKIFDD